MPVNYFPAEFEVLRSDSDQLLLRLIQSDEQAAGNSMAGRALSAAGLQLTGENLSLVNSLLDNRLPVNTESLQTLAKQMKMFPDADPTTLASMHLRNIPLNCQEYFFFLPGQVRQQAHPAPEIQAPWQLRPQKQLFFSDRLKYQKAICPSDFREHSEALRNYSLFRQYFLFPAPYSRVRKLYLLLRWKQKADIQDTALPVRLKILPS